MLAKTSPLELFMSLAIWMDPAQFTDILPADVWAFSVNVG